MFACLILVLIVEVKYRSLPYTIRSHPMRKHFSRKISLCLKHALILSGLLIALSTCGTPAFAQNNRALTNKSTETPKTGAVDRGKYIVEGLSRCGQCHTPRDNGGNPDRSHWLEGAPVWLKSAEPNQDWPLQAPRIAGNPPGTDAEMVTLLTTGIWKDGKYLRQPMPQFRMSRQDAESVVAYLKSLNSTPQ